MRPVKIALCSPGLDRATAGSVTCGLDFLASLIQKQRAVEFFTVAPKDVMKLSPRECDFLLVSFTALRRAVEKTILSRTRDPADVELVCREKDLYKLAEKRADLIGWLDEMPAPWIRRVNDPRERVTRLYATLHREFPNLRAPCPRYPDGIRDAGERYGVPIYKV